MAINSHLSDREFAEALIEGTGPARAHLEQCGSCRAEFDRWQKTLASLPALTQAAAERPADFWQEQQFAIRQMLNPGRLGRVTFPAPAWAAALGLVLFALLLLGGGPAPAPTQAIYDPDHQMLLEVEEALNSDLPEALEPAALLAQEIGNHTENRSSSHSPKEKNHEN
jgi:predicted anti-sigma-YlaC factor YlaD